VSNFSSHTEKTKCPECGSDDCNYALTSGSLLEYRLVAEQTFCNRCTYYKRRLLVDGVEVRSNGQ